MVAFWGEFCANIRPSMRRSTTQNSVIVKRVRLILAYCEANGRFSRLAGMSLFSPSTPEDAVGTKEQRVCKIVLIPIHQRRIVGNNEAGARVTANDFTDKSAASRTRGRLN
jgi:hypothetical protein